jgi:hypothetical protein
MLIGEFVKVQNKQYIWECYHNVWTKSAAASENYSQLSAHNSESEEKSDVIWDLMLCSLVDGCE